MAEIKISAVTKTYSKTPVIHGVDLSIGNGEFIVILGPSGCGKSTLLRMIAGLESISGGEVSIDGTVVNKLEPRERGCAMVFQNYALYPHMSVADNIGYALKVSGMAKAERMKRIDTVAATLGLSQYLDRKPGALSGGQRQRVAMGRAMIREPKAFLYDEPLSNLDAKLRVAMRVEIRKLHQRLGATTIFVTHDQVEAMTLADRIVVMNGGHIEQVGTPREVYHAPATLFVAGFIGAPGLNIIEASVDRSQNRVVLEDGQALHFNPALYPSLADGPVMLGFRAERCVRGADGQGISLATSFSEELGPNRLVHGVIGGSDITVEVPVESGPAGDRLWFGVPDDALHFFDRTTGRRIADLVVASTVAVN